MDFQIESGQILGDQQSSNDNFEDEQDLMLESLEFQASPELTIEESFNELIEEANFRKGVQKVSIHNLPLRVDTLFTKTLNCSSKMLELELVDAKI